jgi:glycine/D-amino acid oxidase-like deaminating enzyme
MDAIVFGAGLVGAASAMSLSDVGLRVLGFDPSKISSGNTRPVEGNILVSDRGTGPELILMQRSSDAWFEISDRISGGFELEAKGGLVASRIAAGVARLKDFAGEQRASGAERNREHQAQACARPREGPPCAA